MPPRHIWAPPPIPTREKRYVDVVSITDRDGIVTPLRIVWRDGTAFDITEVVSRDRRYSHAANHAVLRYGIRGRDRSTYLYYENPRWYVEAKVRDAADPRRPPG